MRYLFFTVALLTARFAVADGLTEAAHSMRAGNYAEAYCVLRPMAEEGDAEAQFNLGWMYQNGYGLAINNSLALEWWRRASVQGHTDASFAVATLYHHGEGDIERDSDKALDYFLIAAEEGHDDAILILRSMLILQDKSIRERSHDIVQNHAYLFGPLMQVRVKRANIRKAPSLEADIVTRLEQGAGVVELNTEGKWSQIGLLDDGSVAWIYTSLLEERKPIPVVEVDDAVAEPVEPEQQEAEPADPDVEPEAAGPVGQQSAPVDESPDESGSDDTENQPIRI